MEMQDNFNDGLRTTKPMSDHHVKPEITEDIKLVVTELVTACFLGSGWSETLKVPSL